MKGLSAVLPLVAVALLASCAEPTSPTADLSPRYAKPATPPSSDKGGGKGSPHFTDGTVCTFESTTGSLNCDYQIAGLGANSTGGGTLVANLGLYYKCDLPGWLPIITVNTVRVDVDFYYHTDKKGNAKGSVSASPLVGPVCVGTITDGPTYSLDANSSTFALPWPGSSTGSWALFGLQNTAKGGTSYIYFDGAWVAPVV